MRSFDLSPDKRGSRIYAANRCCDCSHEWQDLPFGHARFHACPRCGSVYWRWLDYADATVR